MVSTPLFRGSVSLLSRSYVFLMCFFPRPPGAEGYSVSPCGQAPELRQGRPGGRSRLPTGELTRLRFPQHQTHTSETSGFRRGGARLPALSRCQAEHGTRLPNLPVQSGRTPLFRTVLCHPVVFLSELTHRRKIGVPAARPRAPGREVGGGRGSRALRVPTQRAGHRTWYFSEGNFCAAHRLKL